VPWLKRQREKLKREIKTHLSCSFMDGFRCLLQLLLDKTGQINRLLHCGRFVFRSSSLEVTFSASIHSVLYSSLVSLECFCFIIFDAVYTCAATAPTSHQRLLRRRSGTALLCRTPALWLRYEPHTHRSHASEDKHHG